MLHYWEWEESENLCIEQLINDLDQNHESYDLNPIYKVIDKEIAPIKKSILGDTLLSI